MSEELDLSLCTKDELFTELRKRFPVIVLIIGDMKTKDDEEVNVDTGGPDFACLGLLEVAKKIIDYEIDEGD